jgi:proteasome beta subunit
MRFHEGLSRDEAVDLAITALFEAADEDSATGGPDMVRGIYPVIATITSDGFERVDDADIAQRFVGLLDALSSRDGGGRLPETSTETSGGAR